LEAEKPLPSKTKDFSTWYGEVLERAELVDIRYNVKGFIVYRPNLVKIIRGIYEELQKELDLRGHRQALFPLLIPISNIRKEAEHIAHFEEQVFKVTKAGDSELEEELVLRPTSETAFSPMYSLWIKSYKDLPMKLYQSVSVYRHETKATRPLIRGREFLWIETHNVFPNEESARKQVLEDIEVVHEILTRFGMPHIVVKREEWDKFAGAVDTYAFDVCMPDGKVLQVATTHYLGKRFSVPFDIKFQDGDGVWKHVHQTSFGPGVSRIAAAIISIHGDEYGLVLPFDLAIHQVVIVPIPKTGYEEEVSKFGGEVERRLREAGYDVYLDVGEERPGAKFYKWEMLGVPIRIEAGLEELRGSFVTVFRRDSRIRERVPLGKMVEYINEVRAGYSAALLKRSNEFLGSKLVSVRDRGALLRATEEDKIITMGFCGLEECANEIKGTTGYEVRGALIEGVESVEKNCAWCGREAKRMVLVAKSY